jgi:WD40 repeat protein
MEATNYLQTATTETADSGVTSVAILPNGRLVAAGSLDNTVRIWELTLMIE